MLLLARSTVCIALVIAALPNRPGATRDAAVVSTVGLQAGSTVAEALDRFCRRDPERCYRAAKSADGGASAARGL